MAVRSSKGEFFRGALRQAQLPIHCPKPYQAFRHGHTQHATDTQKVLLPVTALNATPKGGLALTAPANETSEVGSCQIW